MGKTKRARQATEPEPKAIAPRLASDAVKSQVALVPTASSNAETTLEIVARTGLSTYTVGKQLKRLNAAGVLRTRKEPRTAIDGVARATAVYWIEEGEVS